MARGLAQLALYRLPDDTFERFVPSMDRVTAEEVIAAAGRLDLNRMVVTVVGDRERAFHGLSGLGLGEPQLLEQGE